MHSPRYGLGEYHPDVSSPSVRSGRFRSAVSGNWPCVHETPRILMDLIEGALFDLEVAQPLGADTVASRDVLPHSWLLFSN